MNITLELDDSLLHDAKEPCGAMADTEVVHLGMRALVRHAACERPAALAGSERNACDVPRHREKPSRKRAQRS